LIAALAKSMSAPRRKKKGKAPLRKKQRTTDQFSTGMPAADSVRTIVDFVSPKKVRYTILETSEMDAYDELDSVQPKSNKKRRPR
jgi:hypothetical protein